MSYTEMFRMFCLVIPLVILLYVVILFFEVKHQMRITYHKKFSFDSILDYPYFSIGRLVGILIFTHSFTCIGTFFNYINQYNDMGWKVNIFIAIIFADILFSLSLMTGAINWPILFRNIFSKPSNEYCRKPTDIVNVYYGTEKEYFEQTLYDLKLNQKATFIWSQKKNEDYKNGDLIIYAEGINENRTGRWILLRITSITKRNKKLEIKAEPCKIISDGTIKIEEEMKKHNLSRNMIFEYEKNRSEKE